MNINDITRPTLLLDMGKCIRNIDHIQRKISESGIIFRPHFKTHQSLYVGKILEEKGINRIAVSSVGMARYFSSGGWNDITIAFPFNPREYEEIANIAEVSKLCITIPGVESARLLARLSRVPVDVMIKIDTGYNRSGLPWDDKDAICETADILNSCTFLNLRGLLSHTGNTYHASSPTEISALFEKAVERVNHSREILAKDNMIISLGDTPSASVVDSYSGFDELRTGNFVFYDMTLANLGVCTSGDIAVAVACPVVDIRKRNNSLVIYGGAVHFSKESIMINGEKVFGKLVRITGNGWVEYEDELYLSSLSQEHGIIIDKKGILSHLRIGDLAGILPVRSQLSSNLLGKYMLPDGSFADHMSGQRS
ncbi:MAG TPA: alanine racemase [Bacteroidales bacterium]|nr:alanine racemase [Bacteroidales bacterium]